jgi:hypothetical protein
MTDRKFRALIALHLALTFGSIGAAFLPNSYSPALSEAYANEPTPAFLENHLLPLAIVSVLLAVWVSSIVGLWMFKRWGRALSLYATIATLAITPFFGSVVLSTGLENALYEAAALCWGAVLALAHYSAINDRFKATS